MKAVIDLTKCPGTRHHGSMTVPGESMERQKEEDLSGKVAIVTGGQHRARGQAGREDDFDERPARILAYFAACENPLEYTGRVFFAERKLAALGLSTGG